MYEFLCVHVVINCVVLNILFCVLCLVFVCLFVFLFFFLFFFFFFKQKTAYEIVSRDWSSDVCSSDLQCLVLESLWAERVGLKGVLI